MGANWWTFLKKIKIQLHYDMALVFIQRKRHLEGTAAPTYTAEFFITGKTWKQPKWIKKT